MSTNGNNLRIDGVNKKRKQMNRRAGLIQICPGPETGVAESAGCLQRNR
jgi:hypothetical protein